MEKFHNRDKKYKELNSAVWYMAYYHLCKKEKMNKSTHSCFYIHKKSWKDTLHVVTFVESETSWGLEEGVEVKLFTTYSVKLFGL